MATNTTKARLITNNKTSGLYVNELTIGNDNVLKVGRGNDGSASAEVVVAAQATHATSADTAAEATHATSADTASSAKLVTDTVGTTPVADVESATSYVKSMATGAENFDGITATNTLQAVNYVIDAIGGQNHTPGGDLRPPISDPLSDLVPTSSTKFDEQVYRKTVLVSKEQNISTTGLNLPPDATQNDAYYAIRYPSLHVDTNTKVVVHMLEIYPNFGKVWYNKYMTNSWYGWVGIEPDVVPNS